MSRNLANHETSQPRSGWEAATERLLSICRQVDSGCHHIDRRPLILRAPRPRPCEKLVKSVSIFILSSEGRRGKESGKRGAAGHDFRAVQDRWESFMAAQEDPRSQLDGAAAAGSARQWAGAARELLQRGGISTLSTVSAKHPGYPFGSVVPYGLDAAGVPVFLLSRLAVHSRNLALDDRATLLVMDRTAVDDPQGAARVSVMGRVIRVPAEGLLEAQQAYLRRHPTAAQYLNFGDFEFYRLEIHDVYFVGGFGRMGWLRAEDL